MRKFSRTGSAAAGALALALTAGAFAFTPAAAARPAVSGGSAASASAPPLTSIRPGHPLTAVGGSRPATAPSFITNGLTTTESANWAGYVATQPSTTFRYVAASFYVPYLDCTGVPANAATYSSHWVGLDGYSSGTVEQTGLLAACIPDSSGQPTPTYAIWYEMYPNAPYYPSVIPVRPGNAITASVYYNKSTHEFRFQVTDHSTGKTFSRNKLCGTSSCPRTSAEVISEAPSDSSGNILPLADFQGVSYSGASVTTLSGTRGGLSSSHWGTTRIYQVSDGSNTDANGNTIPAGTRLDSVTPLVSSRLFDAYWMPGT